MCGIFGFGILEGGYKGNIDELGEFITELALKTSNRGRDATGISFITTKQVKIVKAPMPAYQFIRSKEYLETRDEFLASVEANLKDEQAIGIIGHCRAQTKGPKSHNPNNHPIRSGRIIGVHNGMIKNDDQMFIDNPNWQRRGTVDSEAIFACVDHYTVKHSNTMNAIKHTTQDLEGSMACAMINTRNPEKFWFFRRTNPTTLAEMRKANMGL